MTQVFISYAREDFKLAESIAAKLQVSGYSVFYDRSKIAPGQDPDLLIEEAINRCVLFVFLATSNSIAAGRYTLTELLIAKERWPAITANVLGVIVDSAIERDVPPYLTAASAPLRPQGDVATEVRREALKRLRKLGAHPVSGAPGASNALSQLEREILIKVARETLTAGRLATLRALKGTRLEFEEAVEHLLQTLLIRQWDSDYCLLQRRAFAHLPGDYARTINEDMEQLILALRERQALSRDRMWPLEAIAKDVRKHQRHVAVLLLYAQQYVTGAAPSGLDSGLPTQVTLSESIFRPQVLTPFAAPEP